MQSRPAHPWRVHRRGRVYAAVCGDTLGDAITIYCDSSTIIGDDAVRPHGGRGELVRRPVPVGGVKVHEVTWLETCVDRSDALIEVVFVTSLRALRAPVGPLDSRVQSLQELRTLRSPIGRGHVPAGLSKRKLRRGHAEHELKRSRPRGSMYVGIICVR